LSENSLAWAKTVQRAHLGETTFLLGQNWTREHLSGFQVTSPRRDCLVWARYAENNNLSRKSYSFYYLRATTHVSDELIEHKFTYIPLISTEPHHTSKNQITARI